MVHKGRPRPGPSGHYGQPPPQQRETAVNIPSGYKVGA